MENTPMGVPMLCQQFWGLSNMTHNREVQTIFSSDRIWPQTVFKTNVCQPKLRPVVGPFLIAEMY